MSGLKIFVVENHADTLKYLRLYLEQAGHTVSSAVTMNEALARLPGSGLEVLISDIGLPDGDGWELLRKAQLPSRIFTIAMSGFGQGADHVRSKEAGYQRHLLKPFRLEQLDGMLDQAREFVAAG